MILVDSLMLCRRCHAKMDFLANSEGIKTGMEFGFLRTIESVTKKLEDDNVILCWDNKKSLRKEEYPDYKSNRKKVLDESFWIRLNRFKDFVKYIYPCAEAEGYEADDVMYTLSLQNKDVYIYSNDKDLLQAVRDGVCLITSHNSDLYRWDAEDVLEKFGVDVRRFGFYKSIVGDPGDGVIGVPRIPKKAVAKWLMDNRGVSGESITEFGLKYFSKNMYEKFATFIADGSLVKNYKLICLRNIEGLEVMKETDDNIVADQLAEWEIGSLKICEGLNITCDFEKDAEF